MAMAVTKICSIGAGYVGGPTCSIIAMQCPHIKVTVVDKNIDRISQWNSEKLPIDEPGLDDTVKKQRNVNLFFSTNIEEAIQEADLIFISVNCTKMPPDEDGVVYNDYTDIENCAKTIARVSTSDKIIVEKCTDSIYANEPILQILCENGRPNVNFQILSNPESFSKGMAVENLLKPDEVSIGYNNKIPDSKQAALELRKIYCHWIPEEKIRWRISWDEELTKKLLDKNHFIKYRLAYKVIEILFKTPEDVADKIMTIFGFAFKKETSYTCETPEIHVAKFLLDEDAILKIYDPKDLDYEKIYERMIKPEYIFDVHKILKHEILRAIGFKVYTEF